MRDFWDQINYFKPEEFKSPDSDEDKMNSTLIYALDYVRQQMELPIKINSGYRTFEHNRNVGGSVNSQHLLGNAADIHCPTEDFQDAVEYWFLDYLGQDVGIGRYNTFIHLDVRGHKARWDNRK